jgi:serine phosphatase RsbU (regulator of sigma subunit)
MKNYLLYISFVFVFLVPLTVQAIENPKDKDSLFRLTKSKNKNTRTETLCELAWELRDENRDSSFVLAFKSEKLINKNTPSDLKSYVYHIIGSLYSLEGDYENSKIWLEKAYSIRKKLKEKGDENEFLITLTNLFYTYQGLGDVKGMHKAISESEELVLTIYKEGSDYHILVVLQKAEMYRYLKQKDKAVENFNYAIELAENINKENYYLSMVYTNYGNYFLQEENHTEAIKMLEKGDYYNQKLAPDQKDNSMETNLAIAYAETGQTEKARAAFIKIYERDKLLSNAYTHSTAANNLAYFYFYTGEARKAVPLFEESLLFAKKAGAAGLVADRYQMLSQCYEVMNNPVQELFYLKKYQIQKDSILDAETLKQLTALTAKYDTEKKEKKILELKQKEAESKLKQKESEEALNAEKEQSRRNILIFGSLILVVLIIAGFIFYSYKQKQKANLVLEEKNKKIETQHLLLEEKHKEITDSINYAKRIQTALLTSDEYWHQISPEHFVYFRPKDVVSGDFFWAYQQVINNETIAVWCAADCTGHGVPGAFMSMLGISFLNEIIVEQNEIHAAAILNKLRDKIIRAMEQKTGEIKQRDGMDIALCVWNKTKNILEFAGANNPLWLIRPSASAESNNELTEFKADKMPVGSYGDRLDPFSVKSISLQKGDMIYTFSDGYSDQFGGEKGKKFKESNFRKLLVSIVNLPVNQQKDLIDQNFENWKGQLEQIDDVCVIGIRV